MIIVLLPALRPLRVLRIFTAGQAMITHGGRMSLLRSTEAIAAATSLLVLIAALAALDAERDAPGTHITDLEDALWWAATTVTTVGYGDTYPITGTGRLVAVALMLVGISLVGLITATVAAWFVTQIRGATETEEVRLAVRLNQIESALAEIHAALLGEGRPRRPPEGPERQEEPSPASSWRDRERTCEARCRRRKRRVVGALDRSRPSTDDRTHVRTLGDAWVTICCGTRCSYRRSSRTVR